MGAAVEVPTELPTYSIKVRLILPTVIERVKVPETFLAVGTGSGSGSVPPVPLDSPHPVRKTVKNATQARVADRYM